MSPPSPANPLSPLPWFASASLPLYLAPMAGYTDVVYRELCKAEGADVMVTEFVLADSLVRGQPEVWETVDFTPTQRPMGVQIFGSSPAAMAAAGLLLAERLRPDFLDLNFGCPADRITGLDAGSALLRNPPKLQAIAHAVVAGMAPTGIPVTAKIRLGWDHRSIVAAEVGLRLEDVGVRALCIHGRTREQGYAGEADWDCIQSVASRLTIPVIGNGGIATAADVLRLSRGTPVRGLMIGRAALGYPWIFREIKTTLATGQVPPPPRLRERWHTILSFARLLRARPTREKRPGDITWMRPKLIKLTRGMTGSSLARAALQTISSPGQLEEFAALHLAEFSELDARIQAQSASGLCTPDDALLASV